MVDALQPGIAHGGIRRQFRELVSPDRRRFALRHEIEETSANRAQRGDFVLAGTDGLREALHLQPMRALQRRRGIRHAQTDGAHRGAMHGPVGMRESFRLAVHDDVDVALPPARDGLANVAMRGSEPQRAQHLAELARFFFAGAEFDEFHAAAGDPLVGQAPAAERRSTCSSR